MPEESVIWKLKNKNFFFYDLTHWILFWEKFSRIPLAD